MYDANYQMYSEDMKNQRNVTVKGIELWREKDGWVIRNGMFRSGCYIEINDKQLKSLYGQIKKAIKKLTRRLS